jgi:hypothetical protein
MLASLLTVALAAVTAIFGVASPAQAVQYYMVSAVHSGKCLDVQNASQAHGADVLQANCTGTWNQQWSVEYVGNYFIMRARHSGKCLDVQDASQAHAADVLQANCWGGYNQQWYFGGYDGNYARPIIARHSGKCLDVAHFSTAHGADVIQGNCSYANNQKWWLSPMAY